MLRIKTPEDMEKLARYVKKVDPRLTSLNRIIDHYYIRPFSKLGISRVHRFFYPSNVFFWPLPDCLHLLMPLFSEILQWVSTRPSQGTRTSAAMRQNPKQIEAILALPAPKRHDRTRKRSLVTFCDP
ncbi:hypothetical protein BCF11_2013 [Collimonas sp. PA-H2]|uniref:hypothetical protein n=1 Tax=Collimonas sp. PA-H2 TaxID=1881062 RepID=UPI000C013663|nr:hypothetical protein [Collimonas sp. PA-H2]PFH09613.1 hypothetical protein BCF11_2013 [Collimonas sp. PA-H2]